MLDRNRAQEQLKKLNDEDWLDHRLARLSKLPEPLRNTGRVLLGRSEDGKELRDYDKHRLAAKRNVERFRGLSDKQRRELFAALFGGLAPYVERGHQMLLGLPYKDDEAGRKAFRAPGDPS